MSAPHGVPMKRRTDPDLSKPWSDLSYGERFRTLRLRRGWTQLELSRRSGVSVVVISDMERGRGRITLHSVARLIAALDVYFGSVFD